eukprot:s7166_g2.t1
MNNQKGVTTTASAMAVELQHLWWAVPDISESGPGPDPFLGFWPTQAEIQDYLHEWNQMVLRDVEAVHQQARRHHRIARGFWQAVCEEGKWMKMVLLWRIFPRAVASR